MGDRTACPDDSTLQQLMLGRLPLSEADVIGKHLLLCDRCARAVKSLQAEDALILAARSSAAKTENPDQKLIDGLIDRLQALCPAVAEGTDTGGPVQENHPTAESSQEIPICLVPPRGAGEIGWLGAYQVLRVLGRGGMGVVFEAEDSQLKRRVALKVLKPALAANEAARQRFLREAQAIAALEHEHIVAIYQVGEAGGAPFLAMQLLHGETLETRLIREGPLPVVEVLRLGREIAAGLDAAHRRGLIHRDVKPANLWLEEGTGRIKILDFGLARPLETAAPPDPERVLARMAEAHLTQEGTIAGTPQYMAPEQAAGLPIDYRCDLFGLGCVLYRMGTGAVPFPGASIQEVLAALAQGQPRSPREHNPALSQPLTDLILRLLARDPSRRPGSARAVIEALRDIERRTTRPARGRHWLVLAGAGALVLLIAGATVHYWGLTPTSPKTPEVSGRRATSRARPLAAVTETTAPLRRFEGHSHTVWTVAFSPDSRFALSGSGWPGKDNTMRLWEVASGRQLWATPDLGLSVRDVAFAPNG
jgi:eukaryotic-like serine/threonine-protein kinase